jgi:ABC-2 type transport system permease protein
MNPSSSASMTAPPSPLAPPPGLAASLRKYGKILRISLVERLVYRADFFVSTIFRFLPLVTSFLLWEAVYASSGRTDIAGFTRDTTLAYLLLVQVSRMFSSMPGLAGGISRDIRDGNLKKYLLQPIDMHAYLLASRGAHKIAYIITAALPHALLFWWFREVFPGWPDALTLLAYVASLVLSFVIGFFFEATIGMAGFWLLEVTSLLYIINALNYFVSGQMFPLDFLPAWIAQFLQYLPFQYLAYFPAMVFLGLKTGADLWLGLLMELGWAIAFVLMARILYRTGLRRYSAYGG